MPIHGLLLAALTTTALAAPPAWAAGTGLSAAREAAPATGQPVSDEAKALDEAEESGERVEVLSKRTETSQVFANPSGTFTEESYALPQWARKDNKLVRIDTRLKPASDGMLSPAATTVDMQFSGGGSGPLATITRDGRSMSLSWPDVLPVPAVDGDTATYAEVLPGVDLKLRAGISGYGQLLVVKSAEAAANPALKTLTYGLSTDGVSVAADEHGNLRAVNPAGQDVFTAPTPFMWDSSSAPQQEAQASASRLSGSDSAAETSPPTDEFEPGHGSQQAPMPVDVDGDSLTLTPDQSLLTGADTTYPVYIDPPVSGAREAWAIAYKAAPNTSFYNGVGWRNEDGSTGTTLARAGYEDYTNGLGRSFFRMDSNNLWNTKKQILQSTFRIKNSWSYSCTARSVEVWLTGSISAGSTWNNTDNSNMWATYMDRQIDARGYSSACPGRNLGFNVLEAAKKAAAGRWPNITLGIRAADEGDRLAWKKFDAGSAVLSTEYNTVPNAPSHAETIPSSDSCYTGPTTQTPSIGNTDVRLSARISDPDNGDVQGRFTLWATGHHPSDDPNGVMIVDKTVVVSSGYLAEALVTKATLQQHMNTSGGWFTWLVQAQDGHAVTSGTACRFLFDPTKPSNPPGVTSDVYPDGSSGWPADTADVGEPGVFTLTSSNKPGVIDPDVVKYEYWTDWDPTVRSKALGVPGSSVNITLTPFAAGSHALFVQGIDSAGNKSDRTRYLFYADSLSEPYKPGDVNGDQKADFYGVTTAGNLRLYTGQGNGYVGPNTVVATTDFTGASITHRGDWTNDGYEDLLALIPGAEDQRTLHVFPNNGLGYACTQLGETADGKHQQCAYDAMEISTADPADNRWTDADQILAIGDIDGPLDTDPTQPGYEVPGFPDLLVRTDDQLWLYYGNDSYYLGAPVLVGNGSWSDFDLAAPGDESDDGYVDLIARRKSDGQLRLYDGTGPQGQGLGGPHTVIGTAWTTSNRPLLTAVPDAAADSQPDMWATSGDGKLYHYPDIRGAGTQVGNSGWEAFHTIN
ncbi:FG-GAP repeat domain-containing protein [Streptomyces zhihengii]